MAAQTMQCRVNGGGEGGAGMKTVECLRGRLLAERVASKAAKEEAGLLAKRLDELGKKLADEVNVRNKAERRLTKAIKKLESLKILDVELSDGCIGSLSSNGRSSGHQAPEVEERNNLGSLSTTDSARSSAPGDGASSAGSCTLVNSSSQDGGSCSVVSEQFPVDHCMDLGDTNNNCSSEASAGDHDSDRQQPDAPDCPAKSGHDYRLALVLVDPQLVAGADDSRTEGNMAQTAEHQAGAHEEEAQEENKLALVLVDPQPQPAVALKPHGDVESVLLALQRVKEQLRYTIERRSQLVAHREEVYGH